MTVSLLEGCSDQCGWMAATLSVLCFGSFGVPIKLSSTAQVDVDPLVMQSYKTLVCFATCWFVLLLGEPLRFSAWGIVSGLFWVPGATCGIYGIRHAGLAVAVGTWSSIIVITSFIFGIVIFQERVRNFTNTCFAFIILILGLIGMSQYSQPQFTIPPIGTTATTTTTLSALTLGSSSTQSHQLGGPTVAYKLSHAMAPSVVSAATSATSNTISTLEIEPLVVVSRINVNVNSNNAAAAANDDDDDDDEALVMLKSSFHQHHHLSHHDDHDQYDSDDDESISKSNDKLRSNKDHIIFLGGRLALTRRQLGIIGAAINGSWGGMNLIPLHYATRDAGLHGAGYLISYATGSFVVNTAMWLILYLYWLYYKRGDWKEAAEALPKWHFDKLWYPGFLAGLLYSLGNFGSILAVSYLGQGTGFSFCQMQLFVSGLWGVFYFHEIRGTETICKWFISAAVAVTGIIWLSHEHVGGSGNGGTHR